jgi:hypothetical protein
MYLRLLLRMYRTMSYEMPFSIEGTFRVSKLHRFYAHCTVAVLRLNLPFMVPCIVNVFL